MEEKVLIKGKFSKLNILSIVFIATAIFCFVSMITDYSSQSFSNSYSLYGYTISEEIDVSFIEYFVDGWVFRYALGWFIVFCASIVLSIIFYFLLNYCKLTVTDKRVYGKISFGLRVDLPFDKISSIGSGFFNSLVVATSSNKIHFWLLKNRKEVYEVINNILIERQSKTAETIIKQETPISNADELKKYKDLLDSGVITQEEFEAKKKQLLNL